MTNIRLYNTRTRKKEPFAPIDPTNVRMYVCGPTVYDRAHLGNARPVIVFDVLYRLLRHVYEADHVTDVRNFTDVDDKINAEAQRRKGLGDPRSLEALIRERTEETIGWYHADMDALGAMRPSLEPRATEFIPQMVAMIEGLIASGHAYEKAGHVLFRVRSYDGYGKLSGRSVDDMIAGARVEVAPFKEDPMDFVLWKPSTDDLPGWNSPWGRGRPGWHIECSAMSHELLGETFDIHGGGIDLQFPHHENEIAQSKCAHPHAEFARVWMHNEMLQVEGKKMSKSLGNFFTVRDLLDKGVPGEVIRFVLLQTHYRKHVNWSSARETDARGALSRWRIAANEVIKRGLDAREPSEEVLAHLSNDLNTNAAMTAISKLATTFIHDAEAIQAAEKVVASMELMGFDRLRLTQTDLLRLDGFTEADLAVLHKLFHRRQEAKKVRDFASADAIRDAVFGAGVAMQDTTDGVKWERLANFDPTKLEALK